MSTGPRILIVKLSAIGDCLMTTPTLAALRHGLPGAEIDWVVHPLSMPVVRGQADVRQMHVLPRKQLWKHIWSVARALRREKYDIVIDQQGLLKSAVLTRLTGCRRRYGPAEGREGSPRFYTNLLPDAPTEHVIRHYLMRAEQIGAKVDHDNEPPMIFPVSDEDRRFVDTWLQERGLGTGRLVAINPSAGQAVKQWSPQNFGQVAANLQRAGFTPIITGAPADRELGNGVLQGAGGTLADAVGATSLTQLAALLARCELFVGGDTGPMHMAQAVGSRVLALFGPTDPTRLGPRAAQHQTIYRPGSMDQIQVDEVTEAALTMLKK